MNRNFWTSLRKQGKLVLDVVASEDIKTHVLQAIPFWFASLLTGLIAVGYTKLFGASEKVLQYILTWNRAAIFFVTPLFFLLAWLVIKLAPLARGSGIPQVMAAIDISGTRHDHGTHRLLNLKVAATKICSSLLMVLGGGAIGREGPTIQIAGSVFRFVNKYIPRSWPQLNPKSFILTGAAAGLAAAFNTPLGGIVFAIEELAKIHLSYFRTALFTAVIIAGLTAQGLLGPYLYLGYPDVQNLSFGMFGAVAVSAAIAGLFGALQGRVMLLLLRWKRSFSASGNIGYILVAALVTASFAYFLNPHILGSGKVLINTYLFTGHKQGSMMTLTARFLGPVLSFNVGAAGGIFAPALAAGSAVGAVLNDVFQYSAANANILVLAGMVGFLTGITRTPFTSAILVLEMTDRHTVIFYLMLAALVSNITALVVDKESFYGHLKKDYIVEVSTEETALPAKV